MSIRIKRSRITSPTGRALKQALSEHCPNTKMLLSEGSNWVGSNKSLLVNWGCSKPINPNVRAKILNTPDSINNACNKVKALNLMSQEDVSIPWYLTKDFPDYLDVLAERVNLFPDNTYVFRTKVSGYGGSGVYVIKSLGSYIKALFNVDTITSNDIISYINYLGTVESKYEELLNSVKFITEYFPAKDEFRVHVVCGKVIFAQRKALRTDDQRPETPDFTVRNHSNGFIFQQNNIEVPEMVKEESIKAVRSLGLDFGAVDIRFSRSESRGDKCVVLEVNTAPALTGATLETYTNTFKLIHNVLNQ